MPPPTMQNLFGEGAPGSLRDNFNKFWHNQPASMGYHKMSSSSSGKQQKGRLVFWGGPLGSEGARAFSNDEPFQQSAATQLETREDAAGNANTGGFPRYSDLTTGGVAAAPHYRQYKRRWFGLFQLTLMNIMVSWDWLTYAPVAKKAAAYYSVSESSINWISTAFFLAFVAIFPLAIAVLHRGPKLSMMFAAGFMLVGNWIRYGGSSKPSGGVFPCAMLGTILCGFSQPFVLAAPTRYSDLWFTNRGRVAATALTSLANPFGAALAQLINPLWVTKQSDISNMTLYVAIMTSVACIPAFFIPAFPPSPVGPSAETPKVSMRESIKAIAGSLEIFLILFPFSVYVGFFNSISSLLNQMMTPYGFSDNEAGIGGAVLIVVGLVFSAITSPICDRTKKYLLFVKTLVPVIAVSFFVFIWMPQTRSVAGPYVILAFLGASCFALVPIALECLTELSHPVSPEFTATVAWSGGQLFGAIFIIISDALTAGDGANPPKNMKRALVFQGVLALAVMPLPLMIGLFGRKNKVVLKRLKSDQEGNSVASVSVVEDSRKEEAT